MSRWTRIVMSRLLIWYKLLLLVYNSARTSKSFKTPSDGQNESSMHLWLEESHQAAIDSWQIACFPTNMRIDPAADAGGIMSYKPWRRWTTAWLSSWQGSCMQVET